MLGACFESGFVWETCLTWVSVMLIAGIIQLGGDLPCPVEANGNFTEEVTDFAGR
jgi:hypothetical protein